MKFRLILALLLISFSTSAQQQSLPLIQQVMDHFDKGEYAKLIPVAEKAVETTRTEFGEKSPFHNGMIMFLAMSYWQLYHYPEAEKWLRRNNELTLLISGEQSLEYISGLNRLAHFYRETGKFGESESLYLNADRIAQKFSGGQDTIYAKNLNNLASLYQFMGRYQKAEQLFIKASELFQKLTGENYPAYASALNNLATLYSEMGQYEKSKTLQLKVLDIRKRVLGEAHADYAQSLNNLGFLQAVLGRHAEAEQNYTKAVDIYSKTLGENHPDYASSIGNLAELYLTTGDYNKAEQLYTRALEIRKNTVGVNHADYSQSLNNLATCYETLGLFNKAEQYFLESKERTAAALGVQHPAYVTSLNNLAALYHTRGNYDKAEPLYQEARELRKKLLGEQHPSYAMSLNNLGTIFMEMGQLDKAGILYRQAAEIWKNSLGSGHYHYALALNNLAAVYEEQKQFDQAEKLYRQAMEIRKNVFGENHNEYAISLNNMAGLFINKRQFDQAERMIRSANAIWEKSLPENSPTMAIGLNNLAALYRKWQIRLKESEQLYLQAIEKRKKLLGENHPLTADSENDLALLYMNLKEFEKAEPLLLNSSRKTMKSLQASFPVLSEKEKAGFISENLFFNDCNHSFLFNHPGASDTIVNNNVNLLLFFKSLSLADTRNMLDYIRKSSDSVVQHQIAEWQSVRMILSAQYALPASQRIRDLPDKEAAAEKLEKELSMQSAKFREQQSALRVSMKEVQAGMDSDEAAIEFVSFRYYNQRQTDSMIYAAYIIRKQEGKARFVPLFEEKQLQDLINMAGRSATGVAKVFYGVSMNFTSDAAEQLYKLVWKPLEKHLVGIKKISFSPAGKLYGIAFHALPAGKGKILQDLYELRQYVSTRQIAFRTTDQRNDRQTGGPESIVLMGDADFSMDSVTIAKGGDQEAAAKSLASRGGGATWPALPFTGTEVDSIKKIFDRKAIPAKLYMKTKASEAAVKKLDGHSPAVLHIATHGFYVPEIIQSTRDTGSGRGSGTNTYKLANDPLLRNGLILAGGNYAWSGHIPLKGVDDGILTAYEIAQLNLSQTKLVVLSACETALGDIKGSEGVFGLQRAFKLAGSDKMILSLWQVPDMETALLMTAFYKYWLGGATIKDAFYQARAAMREIYPPFSWAAFVLVE